MRRAFPGTVALLALLIASCVSYPGLTEDPDQSSGDTSNANTGGSVSPNGSPSGGSGGNAGPTPPDDGSDTADPDENTGPAGSVAERLCSRVIVINWTTPDENTVIYYGSGSNFNSWDAGDEVDFDAETGLLINRSNGLQVQSDELGAMDQETVVRAATQVTLTVELNDGSFWLFSSTDYAREVTQWVSNGDPITVARDADGAATLINTRRCTATPATEH